MCIIFQFENTFRLCVPDVKVPSVPIPTMVKEMLGVGEGGGSMITRKGKSWSLSKERVEPG